MKNQQDQTKTWPLLLAGMMLLVLASVACRLPAPPPNPLVVTGRAQATTQQALQRDVAQAGTWVAAQATTFAESRLDSARLGTALAVQSTQVVGQAETLATQSAALVAQNAEIAHLATQAAHDATRVAALVTNPAEIGTPIARNGTMVSYLATRVGALARDLSSTPTPTPSATVTDTVSGTVEIAGGICCAGGTVGDPLQLQVAFSAHSSASEITEMRVMTGSVTFDATQMAQAAWEPFVTSKTYPVPVALNWHGWYVSVQYRDAEGRVSPVFHDDISIEGAPKSPTPTP